MAMFVRKYYDLEEKIINNLKINGVKHRSGSAGLWLGPLVGLTMLVTFLREDNSYSEIGLLVGNTGLGLIVCCLCLYARLSVNKVAAKDFHLAYFLPAIILATSYLLRARKGLLVSTGWGLTVGSLSTWGVIQAMSYLPGCFTLGEATVVLHGASLFLLSCFTNFPLKYHLPPIHDTDRATIILQVTILATATLCLCCCSLRSLRQPILFLPIFLGVYFLAVIPILYMFLDQNPVTWILSFIFSSYTKILIFCYWALCLLSGVIYLTYQIASHSGTTTTRRKIFHLMAVVVFLPGVLWEPLLLYLATGVVLALFIILELLRLLNVSFMGEFLQNGFVSFADEKDSLVSLTPLYLLCGLSVPLWMPTENLGTLPLLSGVLSIGIGDTAASMFGSKWGQHKWPNSLKTIEGTIASIFTQMVVIYCLYIFGYVQAVLLVRSIIAVIVVSVVEARTEQIDNLALPFMMYLCLVI